MSRLNQQLARKLCLDEKKRCPVGDCVSILRITQRIAACAVRRDVSPEGVRGREQRFRPVCSKAQGSYPVKSLALDRDRAAGLRELRDPRGDDDVFQMFLQKQKSAQRYIAQKYLTPYEAV